MENKPEIIDNLLYNIVMYSYLVYCLQYARE